MRNDEFFVSPDLLNSYGFDLTSLDAHMHIANHREGDTKGLVPLIPFKSFHHNVLPNFFFVFSTLWFLVPEQSKSVF